MAVYPLAVYTAEHGLMWKYDPQAIGFELLDGCRSAFGRLPDFDLGEPGFEGVWVTERTVFVMRCQAVEAWDFRGRRAIYLAVTWIPRNEAAQTDFEALLSHEALSLPTHTPRTAFTVSALRPAVGAIAAPQCLPTGFSEVGAVIAGLHADAKGTFYRTLGATAVAVRIVAPSPVSPVSAAGDSLREVLCRPTPVPSPASVTERPAPALPRRWDSSGIWVPWSVAVATGGAVALLLAAVCLLLFLLAQKTAVPDDAVPPADAEVGLPPSEEVSGESRAPAGKNGSEMQDIEPLTNETQTKRSEQ